MQIGFSSCCGYMVYKIAKHVFMYTDIYTKGVAPLIEDRSHIMSCAMWAFHLYTVAEGALLEAQGNMK